MHLFYFLKRRLRRVAQRFSYRMSKQLVSRLGRAWLKHATTEARRTLSVEDPLKILVDSTILDLAITHETKWITTEFQKIGDHIQHAGHLARVPVYGLLNQSDRHREASFLTGLTHLASLGFIKFYTSAELQDEQFRQPMGR